MIVLCLCLQSQHYLLDSGKPLNIFLNKPLSLFILSRGELTDKEFSRLLCGPGVYRLDECGLDYSQDCPRPYGSVRLACGDKDTFESAARGNCVSAVATYQKTELVAANCEDRKWFICQSKSDDGVQPYYTGSEEYEYEGYGGHEEDDYFK